MGVTINYRGRLNSPDLLNSVCDELEDIANEMSWKYHIVDEDLDKPNSSYIEEGVIKGEVPLKGIVINIHPKSEPLSILFNKNGDLRSIFMMAWMDEKQLEEAYLFVKTQFAPIEIHVTIVKLLKYLKKKYIGNLEVIDEGQYWETEDQDLLKEKIDFLNMKIKEVGDLLSSIEKDPNDTPESLINKIEEVLRKRYF